MEENFRFGLKQRIFNWNLRVSREKLGLLQKDLGKLIGLSGATIGSYETLRAFPKPEIQEKIAEVLGVSSENLFPQWLREFRLKDVPAAREERSISLKEAAFLNLFRPENLMIEGFAEELERNLFLDQLRDQIEKILETLTSREKRIIELRFGLEDGRKRTLGEVGEEFNITHERVSQIEFKALRKLRHPSRSRRLKTFIS